MAASGTGALAAAINRAGKTSDSQIRIGKVVGYSETAVTVRVAGGDVQDFPYLRQYDPIIGEDVVLAAAGSAWIVIGGLAGMPADNPVINGGFEDNNGSTTGWAKVDQTGTSTLSANSVDPFLEGASCAQVHSSSLNLSTVVYSSAIPVQRGQQWSADAYFRSTGGDPDSLGTILLLLTWYANSTNVYPTTSSADSEVSVQVVLPSQNTWSLMRGFPGAGGFAVPAGTTHMRVAFSILTSALTQVPDVLLDRVVARNVT